MPKGKKKSGVQARVNGMFSLVANPYHAEFSQQIHRMSSKHVSLLVKNELTRFTMISKLVVKNAGRLLQGIHLSICMAKETITPNMKTGSHVIQKKGIKI